MIFVGVTGGRDYGDYEKVRGAISLLREQVEVAHRMVIVHGGARGADSLADRAARELRLDLVVVPALWPIFGKPAGKRRNSVIAALPLRYILVFPGHTGTADMAEKAEAAGIKIIPCGV